MNNATVTLIPTEVILDASDAEAKEMIRQNLLVDDRWLVRGLLALYQRQTSAEQQSQSTRLHNKVGFNATDAGILSSYAEQVKKWEATPERQRRFNKPLSPKQLSLTRTKLVKYTRQLLEIAKAKVQTGS